MRLVCVLSRNGVLAPAHVLARQPAWAGLDAVLLDQGYERKDWARVHRLPGGALHVRLIWRQRRSGACAVVTGTLPPGCPLHAALAEALAA